MSYRGRPGLSPISATLLASGMLAEGDLTLDVGCGDGTETLGLAARGIPVVGVDWYGTSRAAERARREGLSEMCAFVRASALHLPDVFEAASFDAAIDLLVYNNLLARQGWKAGVRYLRGLAKVLRPGGVAALAWRLDPRSQDPGPGEMDRDLPGSFFRDFDAGPVMHTHLPTRPTRSGDRGYATVGLVVARRRG